MTFIIKFLPILNGISIIHVYSKKKLSRMIENSNKNGVQKNYKEIELLFGKYYKIILILKKLL